MRTCDMGGLNSHEEGMASDIAASVFQVHEAACSHLHRPPPSAPSLA